MQQAAQLQQRRIGVGFHQLPQTLLIRRADHRRRTPSTRFGGDRPFNPTLAEKLLHEPAAHAEPIGHLLMGLGLLVTRRTDPLAKIQGVGFHATPPADLTVSSQRVCSNRQTALVERDPQEVKQAVSCAHSAATSIQKKHLVRGSRLDPRIVTVRRSNLHGPD
jgi:hypothetical protein